MSRTVSDLVLRPLVPDDEQFARRLSERVFAPYSANPGHVTASMLRERGAQATLAEREGEPLGFFVLAVEPLRRAYGPIARPVVARLNAIAVRPRTQGRGVGSCLLDEAERLARLEGAVVLSLTTAEGNAPALHLFEAHGFLRFLRADDTYVHRQAGILMMKPLWPPP